MTPDRYIEYDGKQYPVYLINIINQGAEASAMNMEFIEVPISLESLSQRLIDQSIGAPINSIATAIDEEIFFYIPDDMAFKSEVEVADYVSDNCW